MKIIILAFITSIIIHLLVFNEFKYEANSQKSAQNKPQENKTDVKLVKLKPIEQPKVGIPQPEIKQVEKIIKEKKIEAKKVENKPIIKEIKPVEKVDIEKAKKLQFNVLSDQIINKENSIQEKTLENFLSQKEPINKEVLNELQKLYGEEYENLTKVQKAYLEKNFNNFQVITQRVLNRLGYPRLAAKLKIGGVNVVEFTFYPDGSISNLKITNSSGYSVLDDYSLELIEIAYKDYPKPTTPTKLKFYVRYSIF